MTTFDHILSLATGLVTIMSALASFVNHVVRSRQDAGKPVAPALLGAGTVVNLASINVDKAIQLAKLLKAAKGKAEKTPDAKS